MILIIDFGSRKTPYILESVDEYMDCEVCNYLDFDETYLIDKNGIVLSGAPILVTEVNYQLYLDNIKSIFELSIPILGICFGHQLLGLHFGAEASKMKEDRDWQSLSKLSQNRLFDKLPDDFPMMEDHCECISIPAEFDLIAVSDACVNEAMQHKNLPYYGVQFHPEVSGNHGRIIFENFVKICEEYSKVE